MAYLDTRRRPSLGGLAAVVAIHGAVGAALILGLTVSGVIEQEEILTGITIRPAPPPPPPPKPADPKPKVAASDPYLPPIPFPLPTNGPEIDTTKVFPTPAPPRRGRSPDPRRSPIRCRR